MNMDDAARYSFSEPLRDGRSVLIRAIRPDDKGLLVDTLGKISPQSLYFRLFSAKRKFSDDELKQVTVVDFVNIVALVAVLEKDGIDRIVGGGRYIQTGSSRAVRKAEVAFLTDDAYQGLGIGSRILKHLVIIARASGITQFEAEVLPSNEGMLKLFTRSGLPLARATSRDSIHVTVELNAAEAPVDSEHAGSPE